MLSSNKIRLQPSVVNTAVKALTFPAPGLDATDIMVCTRSLKTSRVTYGGYRECIHVVGRRA